MKRISNKEIQYLKEVLKSEFSSSKNPNITNRLENKFAKIFNSKFAIAFTNGTSTMHSCLEAFGVGFGDEVLVPPLTMSSVSMAVLQCNATPIFVDIDKDSFLIDEKKITNKISKRTKAIIVVSLYGLTPEMDTIMKNAKVYNLKVIEDNAECFLGYYKNRITGSLGHCASFSFQSSKHITSGEGGMVITNDEKLANKIRKVQSLGYANVDAKKGKILKSEIQDPKYKRHEMLGWNYRMSELCSAVALGQLDRIHDLVKARIRAAEIFFNETISYHSWFVPQKKFDYIINSYWTWAVRLNTSKVSWYRFRNKFLDLGGDNFYAAWQLTYLEPFFRYKNFLKREKFILDKNLKTYKKGLCPVAEFIQPRLIQFKTNYWDINKAYKQALILKNTLKYFN